MKVFLCLMRWAIFMAFGAGAVASFQWVLSVDSPDKTAQVIGGMLGSFVFVYMFGKIIYMENLFVTVLGVMIILAGFCGCVLTGFILG